MPSGSHRKGYQLWLFTFLLLASLPTYADFGARPIGWTDVESADFQDYVGRSLNQQRLMVPSFWMHYWLEQKVRKLSPANESSRLPTRVFILKRDNINAFAMPGQVIGLHRGLWRVAEDDSELLSVVAHEMGHLSLDHFSRLSQQRGRQPWLIASGILLSILLADQNPEAANATLFGTLAGSAQSQLNFSRAMELEADQWGQQRLADAGLDPDGARRFFDALTDATAALQAFEYLSTHPIGTSRTRRLTTPEHDTRSQASYPFRVMQAELDGKKWPEPNESTDESDPFSLFLTAHYQFQQNNNIETLQKSLTQLLELHPSFLPARIDRIKLFDQTDPALRCTELTSLTTEIRKRFITLDVVQIMADTSRMCDSALKDFWHAEQLWQSGREAQAVNYLRNRLQAELTTNDLARLREQLRQYEERLARSPS